MAQCFFEPIRQPAEVFYKDEGGKQNQLAFRVHFVYKGTNKNSNGNSSSKTHHDSYYNAPRELLQLADEEGNVPLAASLLLEDGVTPADEDGEVVVVSSKESTSSSSYPKSILKVVSSTEDKDQIPCFSLQTGYGGIRYRIEKVSKRMDGQRYVVLLTIPGLKELNPKLHESLRIISHPTLVLSKRKNRSIPPPKLSQHSNTLNSSTSSVFSRAFGKANGKRSRSSDDGDDDDYDDDNNNNRSVDDGDDRSDRENKDEDDNPENYKDIPPVLFYPRSATGESYMSAAGSLTGLNTSPVRVSKISTILERKNNNKIASFPIMSGDNSRDIASLHAAFMDVQRYCIRLGKEVEELRAALRHIATKSPSTFPPELQKSLSQAYSLDFESIASESNNSSNNNKTSNNSNGNSSSSSSGTNNNHQSNSAASSPPGDDPLTPLAPYSRAISATSSIGDFINGQLRSGADLFSDFHNTGPSFSKNLDLWISTLTGKGNNNNNNSSNGDSSNVSRPHKQVKRQSSTNSTSENDQSSFSKPNLRRDFSSSSIFAGQDIELTPPAFNTRSQSGVSILKG